MQDMPEKDWVDDESLSAEETMARFEALGPTPTSPVSLRPAPRRFEELFTRRITTQPGAHRVGVWAETSSMNQPTAAPGA